MFARKVLLLMVVTATFLLTACAGGPEKAAKDFLEAGASGDSAAALDLTCGPLREQIQMTGIMTAGIAMLLGVDPQSATADLSDLKFEMVSESGDAATVNVNGEIMLSFLGAVIPQVIDTNFNMVKEDGEWKYCGG